jgi:hypothetical protein
MTESISLCHRALMLWTCSSGSHILHTLTGQKHCSNYFPRASCHTCLRHRHYTEPARHAMDDVFLVDSNRITMSKAPRRNLNSQKLFANLPWQHLRLQVAHQVNPSQPCNVERRALHVDVEKWYVDAIQINRDLLT